MVGFVQEMSTEGAPTADSMSNFKAVCFFANQTSKFKVETSKEIDAGSKQKFSEILKHDHLASKDLLIEKVDKSASKSEKKKVKKASKRSNLHLEHKPSDEMDLLISTLNDAELGWKADTCKLQKHHSKYGEGQVCEG